MTLYPRNSPFARVTTLAGQRPVHAAFAWLHGNPKRIMDWQTELVNPKGAVTEVGLFDVHRRAKPVTATFARLVSQAL